MRLCTLYEDMETSSDQVKESAGDMHIYTTLLDNLIFVAIVQQPQPACQ